jgi:hypothetical protein
MTSREIGIGVGAVVAIFAGAAGLVGLIFLWLELWIDTNPSWLAGVMFFSPLLAGLAVLVFAAAVMQYRGR